MFYVEGSKNRFVDSSQTGTLPAWISLDMHATESENYLTDSKYNRDSSFDERVATMFGGLYAPLRPEITDILNEWKDLAVQAWSWNTEDEYEEEEHAKKIISYIHGLHDYSHRLRELGHPDLAMQAQHLRDRMHRNYQDPLYKQFLNDEVEAAWRNDPPVLDKPVFFVVDFDYTLAQTHDAHSGLMHTAYHSLPPSLREQITPKVFEPIFLTTYKEHQKKAGMHTPEVFIQDLTAALGLPPESMVSIYDGYVASFAHHLYPGTGMILERWGSLGRRTILTFGDEVLQSAAVGASGVAGVVDGVLVVRKKSPEAIELALWNIGYEGVGYIIGVGDRPSDTAAIKAFSSEAVSVRLRHPGAKYAEEEPKTEQETPDFDFTGLHEMDFNLNKIFQAMAA